MLASLPALAADALTVSAAPAREAPAAEASAEPKATWYGWQTLLTDTGSALLIAFSAKVDNGEGGVGAVVLAGLGIGGYVFGGPIVHWGHDRDLIAYVDFSMRLGFPLLLGQLAVLGANQSDIGGSCTVFCGTEGSNFGEGLLVGIGTAVLVDAVGLSWEFASPKTSGAAARTPGLRWTPVAGAAHGGAIGGVGGTF